MSEKKHFPDSKHANLTLSRPEPMAAVMKALGSPLRLQILQAIGKRSMHVNDISERLGLPASTVALNIRILEDAGLIITQQQPGVHGVMKLCSRRLDSISVNLVPPEDSQDVIQSFSLPIGAYSLAEDIAPTCGLADERGNIGEQDNPRSFFHTERFQAQILWFRHGYVTYHFSLLRVHEMDIKALEIVFEACSEAPMHHDPWKSDISLSINNAPIGVWTSPADFGGRRGLLNPASWGNAATQYGMLKTWRVDQTGSYLESERVSETTLSDLSFESVPYLAVKLGVSPRAQNVGGMNLFGRRFGDFPVDLVLRVHYSNRG